MTTAAATAPAARAKETDEAWLKAGREFVLRAAGHPVVITRYDDERRLLPNSKWLAMFPLGPGDFWYTVYQDGEWVALRTLTAQFTSRTAAYTAAVQAVQNMITSGQWKDLS